MDRTLRTVLLVAGTGVLATVAVTWYVADVLYDIGLPRCGATGRRVSSCAAPDSWHGSSSGWSALLGPLLPLVLAGVYLAASSRTVRRVKPRRREELRRTIRSRCALALLVVVAVTVPATMLVRSTFPG